MSEPEAIRFRREYARDGSARAYLDQAAWPQAIRISDELLSIGSPIFVGAPRVGTQLTISTVNARAVYRLEHHRDLYADWDATLVEGEVWEEHHAG